MHHNLLLRNKKIDKIISKLHSNAQKLEERFQKRFPYTHIMLHTFEFEFFGQISDKMKRV